VFQVPDDETEAAVRAALAAGYRGVDTAAVYGDELRAFHAERGIVTEAWAPLAQGAVLDNPVIGRIAERVGRTPAQVILRWHLQPGNVVIPKSVTPARIRSNFELFDVELSQADLAAIAGLDTGRRNGPDPEQLS
jgi:diketogulonate reductase-like aldo/keto reductase